MNAIKKIIATFFIVCFVNAGKGVAQTILLSVDRGRDSIPSQRGANLKKFSHLFLYFGFVAGSDNAGAEVMYGPSVEYGFGVRKKYKISPLYSLGWELGMNEKIFKLKQEGGKTLPDTLLSDVQRMEFGSIYTSFYSRFNFDTRRGNFMGTFLDIGIRAHWLYSITDLRKNALPNGSRIRSQITSLPYTNDFSGDVFARLGKSHFSLYAIYRISDFFRPLYQYPELPALTIGIDVGVFSY